MKKIDSSLVDFLTTVTTDFMGLIGKIEQMKDNMQQLKRESEQSRSEYNQAQIEANKRGANAKLVTTINEENDIQEEQMREGNEN